MYEWCEDKGENLWQGSEWRAERGEQRMESGERVKVHGA